MQRQSQLQKRINILDSFRGIAALIVFFHHTYTKFPQFFISRNSFFGDILWYLSSLNLASVIFFFFISGFSIALSLKGEMHTSPPVINYYLYRRFRRIIPMYLTALLLTIICGLINGEIWFNKAYNIKSLIGNLFFLQSSNSYAGNWIPPYGNNGPLWSLSFEVWYYIFLPILLLFLNAIFKNEYQVKHRIHFGLLFAWVASVLSIWLNKQLFLPWIAFLTLFILWYLGYWLGVLYQQNKISMNHLLFLCFMTSIHFVLSKFIVSATLEKLLIGSVISTSFVFLFLLKKQLKSIFYWVEKLINGLFKKIGQFSYALYLFHFPLLVLCKYIYPDSRLALVITVLFVFILSFTAEFWFRKQKFSIFIQNYFPVYQLRK